MSKITIGYIFNDRGLKGDEKFFIKVAKKRNVDLVMINTSKDLNEEEIEEKAKKCDIFFNNSAEDISFEIAKTLEELGKKVIDSSEQLYYSEDKWMFFIKCKRNHIPTPRTILLSENENIAKKELKKFDCWPVILKRVEGTMGQFVDKAENLTEAVRIMKKFWRKGIERLPIIAQEFIDSPSYRVTVVGDEIVQTVIKESRWWKATGVYAKHFRRFKVDKEIEGIVKKITKSCGIKICGIDFVKRNGRWLVLEINSAPGLDFFRNEEEKLVGNVMDYLIRQVK